MFSFAVQKLLSFQRVLFVFRLDLSGPVTPPIMEVRKLRHRVRGTQQEVLDPRFGPGQLPAVLEP